MTHDEIADVENIIRRARKGQSIALELQHSALVDNLEMIITYAESLLPIGNRFRRD